MAAVEDVAHETADKGLRGGDDYVAVHGAVPVPATEGAVH
jgi:hypothetical protein